MISFDFLYLTNGFFHVLFFVRFLTKSILCLRTKFSKIFRRQTIRSAVNSKPVRLKYVVLPYARLNLQLRYVVVQSTLIGFFFPNGKIPKSPALRQRGRDFHNFEISPKKLAAEKHER